MSFTDKDAKQDSSQDRPCISAYSYWPSGRLWPINHDPLNQFLHM